MINIIAIVVVLVIVGIIRGLVESRKEVEESPLDQTIRINEMKMADTAYDSKAAEISSYVMKENIENNVEKTEENDIPQERWDTINLMESILTDLGCQRLIFFCVIVPIIIYGLLIWGLLVKYI